jgi:hypothetical protein
MSRYKRFQYILKSVIIILQPGLQKGNWFKSEDLIVSSMVSITFRCYTRVLLVFYLSWCFLRRFDFFIFFFQG